MSTAVPAFATGSRLIPFAALTALLLWPSAERDAQGSPTGAEPAARQGAHEIDYAKQIKPLLTRYCFRCHGAKRQRGDIRLDGLDPDMVKGPDAEGWHAALDMINGGEMPPSKAKQMKDEERRLVVRWLTESLEAAKAAHKGKSKTVLRRLNRAQYSNALQDLLGVRIDYGRILPADGKSEMGFTNNGEVLQASTLHLDYYQQIARSALAQAVFAKRPPKVHYRVTFGAGIGKGLVAGRTGGYQSVPLATQDFRLELLGEDGKPRAPKDNAEKVELDKLKRRISIGLRGSSSDRFRVVEQGMLLFSALPHREKVPKSWQGPSPNVKLEMQRCFPEKGDFVTRVRASRGFLPPTQKELLVSLEDADAQIALTKDRTLVVPRGAIVLTAKNSKQRRNLRLDGDALVAIDVPKPSNARFDFAVPEDGFYQVDLVHPAIAPDVMPSVRLHVRNMKLDMRPVLDAEQLKRKRAVTTLGAAGLRRGRHNLRLGGPFFTGFSHVVITKLDESHPLVRRLTQKVEDLNRALLGKTPAIRTFVGTRTDDGMDYKTFGKPVEVTAPLGQAKTYAFRGRLEDLPIPEPESGDTEPLSGFMLLGLWNDHLVKSAKNPGPPLLVEAIEFEAPFFDAWPPKSHSTIFFDSPKRGDEAAYTREVLARFLPRAFRRPLEDGELDRYLRFWKSGRKDFASYEESVTEVLVAALCSPNFLYMAEPSGAASASGANRLDDFSLANRLAFFLWNSPPDEELLALAATGMLRAQLEKQVDRMIDDERAWRFVRAFGYEWLRLDRHESMTINPDRYPKYTRFVKRDMAEETCRYLHEVMRADLPIWDLIDSDWTILNQNLAEFYGIDGVEGIHFRKVRVPRERGGLLAQGSFLAGHSDGSQPHPIKRAVWLKEKILGDPPPPPPPNVPDLDPETPGFEKLTLKQQLEAHRDKASCRDCHASIDPYGVVFERYSAAGLKETKRRNLEIDVKSKLPDGSEINGVAELKAWILTRQRKAFANSLISHLFAYALGRDVHFADDEELAKLHAKVQGQGNRMRAVLKAVATSDSFTQR